MQNQQAAAQAQHHNAGKDTQQEAQPTRYICTTTILRDGIALGGNVLEDGTYEFVMERKLQRFDSIPEVWKAWDLLTLKL